MTRNRLHCVALVAVLAGALGVCRASDPLPPVLPPCEPGNRWEQVTEYKEVCREVCKIVPDVKKTTKWVYSQVDDPFCIHRSGAKKCHHLLGHLGLHGKCDKRAACPEACPYCEGPYCRKQLVKRQMVCEEPTTKCVIEKVVERVPCVTYRKVPCAEPIPTPKGAESPGPIAPLSGSLPALLPPQ